MVRLILNNKSIFTFVFFILFLVLSCQSKQVKKANVLVITNSASPSYCDAKNYLLPYLEHFGLPYAVIDIHDNMDIPKDFAKYDLIIIAHKQIDEKIKKNIKPLILEAVENGTGLVSFDFHFVLQKKYRPVAYVKSKQITFSTTNHFITAKHDVSEKCALFGSLTLPAIEHVNGKVLLNGDGNPLLVVLKKGKGRISVWTSMQWMQTFVLGPLGGLDDCLWRSFVWAAKKPFVMRGLAPIVTMRVDDVAGRGNLWGKSYLYWVKIANHYGFKPFLALFIYNLHPKAIDELRDYLLNGQATASPHAFGRPPRMNNPKFQGDYFTKNIDPNYYKGFYYDPDGLPLRSSYYDEFIFFNWHKQKPWNDHEALRGLKAVDEWYKKHQPLSMSKYLIPHWYEIGTNVIPYISEQWGIEFIGIAIKPDMYYSAYTPWLKAGPFRLHEEPGAGAFVKELRAQRPIYYADFLTIANKRLFNCLTEVRDITGYEWAPDNNVPSTIERGVKQLKRALNSMALSVLFTHETDFIEKIKPENWQKILEGVRVGVEGYHPAFMTMDDALRYVRAVKTSKLQRYISDNGSNTIKVYFSGKTDVATHFYLFTEKGDTIHSRLVEVPVFKKSAIIRVNMVH